MVGSIERYRTATQGLPRPRLGHGAFLEAGGGLLHHARRSLGEDDVTVRQLHHSLTCSSVARGSGPTGVTLSTVTPASR